jgi:hypothetical protein
MAGEERGEAAIAVCAGEPTDDAIGIMLVARAVCASEATAPQRRIDFGNGGTASRNVPAVECWGLPCLPGPSINVHA